MRKLRLDVDSLGVESFATASHAAAPGTVRGAEGTYTPEDTCATSCAGGPYCDCVPVSERPCDTCATSCAGGPYCDCLPSGCPVVSVCCPVS